MAAVATSSSRFEPIEQATPCAAAKSTISFALRMPPCLPGYTLITSQHSLRTSSWACTRLKQMSSAITGTPRLATHPGQRRVVAVGRGLLDQRHVAIDQLVETAQIAVSTYQPQLASTVKRNVRPDRFAHRAHAARRRPAASRAHLDLDRGEAGATSSLARAAARSGS